MITGQERKVSNLIEDGIGDIDIVKLVATGQELALLIIRWCSRTGVHCVHQRSSQSESDIFPGMVNVRTNSFEDSNSTYAKH